MRERKALLRKHGGSSSAVLAAGYGAGRSESRRARTAIDPMHDPTPTMPSGAGAGRYSVELPEEGAASGGGGELANSYIGPQGGTMSMTPARPAGVTAYKF